MVSFIKLKGQISPFIFVISLKKICLDLEFLIVKLSVTMSLLTDWWIIGCSPSKLNASILLYESKKAKQF